MCVNMRERVRVCDVRLRCVATLSVYRKRVATLDVWSPIPNV